MTLSQVLPKLLVGSHPINMDDIDRLKRDYGITAILNLQTDGELDPCEVSRIQTESHCDKLEIAVRWIPVEAFVGEDGVRRLSRCAAMLDELLRSGHAVYVHCNLGTVRSPTVVIAYLARRQGWDLTDAVEYMRRCHPCSPDICAILLAEEEGKLAA
jgi:atypical dual specificity phosphatase